MKIGFIGCGNMARPIIRGIISKGISGYGSAELLVNDIRRDTLEVFCTQIGASAAGSNADIVRECDVVILATKPQAFPEALPELAPLIKEHSPLVLSIAAGKTLGYIASLLGEETRIGRMFPNLNASVGESVTAYCANSKALPGDMNIIRAICQSFGAAVELDESLFPVFGVLSGCAPAYTFMYIGALAKAAAANGLEPSMALEVACRMAAGSAETLKAGGVTPEEMIDRVCSPGGTTIEGITYLRENGFEKTIGSAFRASLDKDKRL